MLQDYETKKDDKKNSIPIYPQYQYLNNIDEVIFLASIAQNIQDPIIATDLNGNITRWNKSAEDLFEWKASEVIGKNNLEILKYQYQDETKKDIFDIINKIGVYKGEYKVYSKSKKLINVLATISRLKDNQNNIVGTLTLLRDVTEIKETRKQVLSTEKKFKTLAENGIDGIIILNKDAQSTYVSPSVTNILGYYETEVKRLDVFTLAHPDDRDSIMEVWDKTIANPKIPIDGKPARFMHKNGSWHLVKYTLTNFFDDPSINGIVNNFWDITDRNEINNQLTIAEFVIENAGDSILFVASDASILKANKAACEKLDYTKEEILKLKIFDIDSNFNPQEFNALFNLLRQTKSKLFESTILTKNGTVIPVEVWLNHIKHNDEELNCAFIRDISKRKMAKEKLLATEKKFRALVENSTDGVVILNTDGKPIYTSPSVEKLLGYTEENTPNLNLFDIVHPEDIPFLSSIWNEVLTTSNKPVVGRAARFLHKNGSWRWFESTLTNLLNEPTINGIVDNFWDVTEKKEAEDKIIDKEKFFRALVESSSDACALISGEAKPLYISNAIEKVLGYTEEEAFNLELFTLFHPDDIDWAVGFWQQILNSPGIPIYIKPTRKKHKDGEWRWIESTVTNLLHDPAVNGIVENFRDVTARVIAEEKQKKINRLYSFISNVNNMIVQVHNEQTLYNEVCRIAVEVGQFKMSWIGMVNETAKIICPVACTGTDTKYLAKIKTISIEDIPEGRGPGGTAIRENRYVICNDIENDEKMVVWKKEATTRGYHSAMTLPIKKNNKAIGIYTIYAATKNFFDEEEIELLVDVADNINFALDNFEKERKRKKTEQAILQSEASLKEAQSIAHIGNWDVDVVNNKHYWSDEVYHIFGISRRSNAIVTYDLFLSFIHPKDFDIAKEVIDCILQDPINSPEKFRFRFIRADGELRYGHLAKKCLFDKENNFIKLYGIVQDVSESVVAEKNLRKSEAFSAGILNSLNSCIAVLDKTGKVIKVNQAWKLMAASVTHPVPNFISEGKNYVESINKIASKGDILAKLTLDGIKNVMAGNKSIYQTQYYFKPNASNEKWWFDMTVLGFISQSDMVIINIQDITELKKVQEERDITIELNEELENTKQELSNALEKEKELNELKSRFVSMASHEFRTPLTTMMLSLTLANKYVELIDADNAKKHLTKIKKQINDLNDILNEFLSLSKLEEGRIDNKPEEVDLKLFISEIISDMKLLTTNSHLFVYNHLGDDNVIADKKLLKNVLLNLISNAIKYSGNGNHVDIDVNVSKEEFKIAVKDDGIGISAKDQEHLFERFFRGENATHIQGTGLGLSIVARYTQLMNGQINFISEENKGSTFTITIPISD
jgi:PAS domain S-box-containing protein